MVEERRYRFTIEDVGPGPQDRFAPAYGGRSRWGRRLRAIAIGGAGTALADQTAQGTATQAPATGMSVQVAGIPILMDDGTGRLVLVDLKVPNAGDDPFLFNTSRMRMQGDAGQSYGRVR